MIRRGLTIFLALLALPLVDSSSQGRAVPNRPANSSLELQISGPRLIRRGDHLRFKGKIANHSANPVAFALRQGDWDCDGVYRWKITDVGERELPPMPVDPVPGMLCCLTSPVSEDELIVLQPGQEYTLPELADPSDSFVFPRSGFYRVSVRFIFNPRTTGIEQANRGAKWELVKKTGRVDVSSNEWQMYLSD